MATLESTVDSARYYVGSGVVLADDFMSRALTPEQLAEVDTSGAMVWRLEKPVRCMFFAYGMSGAFIPNVPVSRVCHITRTEAEQAAMSNFVMVVDPHNKYGIRVCQYVIDLKESGARLVKRPTDDDIAHLSIRFKNYSRGPTSANKRKKLHLAMAERAKRVPDAKRKAADDRMRHELCALDRRRYVDCGIIPPESRADNLKRIVASAKRGEPDLTESESESVIPTTTAVHPIESLSVVPPTLTNTPAKASENLFGSDDEADGVAVVKTEATSVSSAVPPRQKRARKIPTQRDFDAALRALQGRRQTQYQQPSGYSEQLSRQLQPCGGGGGGDD
jgi:hypothetical protein